MNFLKPQEDCFVFSEVEKKISDLKKYLDCMNESARQCMDLIYDLEDSFLTKKEHDILRQKWENLLYNDRMLENTNLGSGYMFNPDFIELRKKGFLEEDPYFENIIDSI